jgi:NAD(P)-dependent dehydrogenase (short-subunit alcohol dehydrogenase family)
MPKTILVTGANGNLGPEVVARLHQAGYSIFAAVGRSALPDDFSKMTKAFHRVNLTDEISSRQFVEEVVLQSGGISAAVMLVGGFAMGSIGETDGEALDKMINLNFKTAFFTAQPLLEHFEKNGGGQFIFVGARPALSPEAGKDMLAYALSKSLVFRLAEIINAAGKRKHITASVIVPSTIDTAANRQAMPEADFSKWVKPENLAQTIVFLLSDAGSNLREAVLKVYNEA